MLNPVHQPRSVVEPVGGPIPPEPGSRDEMIQRLHRDSSPDVDVKLTFEAMWTFGIIVVVGALVVFLLRPWLTQKKKAKRQPLVYDKIITDDSNVRGAIRVDLYRPVTVTGLRVQGKHVEFKGRAASLDISMGGMSLLCTSELPHQADLNFIFQESEIASSPPLNGVVLQTALWKEESEPGQSIRAMAERQLGARLYLVRLSFVNLSPESKLFLGRLIAQKERESLTAMKDLEYKKRNEEGHL